MAGMRDYPMLRQMPRGMGIDQATRSGQRQGMSILNNSREHVVTSGQMASGDVNVGATLTFPIPVDIVAVSGFALVGDITLGTGAIGYLDTFSLTVSRETGDKLYTQSVPAFAVLGSGSWPALLPRPFQVNGGEALDIQFNNLIADTCTAYVVFWAIEKRS